MVRLLFFVVNYEAEHAIAFFSRLKEPCFTQLLVYHHVLHLLRKQHQLCHIKNTTFDISGFV